MNEEKYTDKTIELYEFYLNEKIKTASTMIGMTKTKTERDFWRGQLSAFQQMLSFNETLKRTL